MKTAALLLAFLFASGYQVSTSYFSRTRNVAVQATERQNYFVVDADIWKYARPDLSDLRLYDGQAQVPYALIEQSGGSSSQQSPARILNLGRVGDHTEFDLDVRGLNEYGRVHLYLDAKNFINNAQIEGRSVLNDRSGTALGSSTLYDFTAEGLGSNFVLKFPPSSFPYLHLRLAPGLNPSQIKGAYVSNFSETKAAWSQAGTCTPASDAPKQSVFDCSLSAGMPLERLAFDLPANVVNFNRTVVVSDEKGNELERGSISRVRMNRAGQIVISEDLAIDLYHHRKEQIRITIENGDDAPLPVQQLRPLSIERRVYFDPKGKLALQLYYGDPKLGAPSYDYGKFFQSSPDVGVAQLGPAEANPQFKGRPDDRPWSERHNGILWIAMLVAVALLGGLALRGLTSKPASKP
jgi:hypothetical protein